MTPGKSIMHASATRVDVVITGDPQPGYYDDAGGTVGDPHLKSQADHVKMLLDEDPNLKWAGLIINGDLVNTPNTQSQIDLFLKYWEKGMKGYTVWPGLGNHDYANYVNLNREGSYGKFKAGNDFKAAVQGFNDGVGQLFDYLRRALGKVKANLYAFDFHQFTHGFSLGS